MPNPQPSRSVDQYLLEDLKSMTAQLPEDSSFNRRLRCLITELRALKSALPIQISVPVSENALSSVGMFPYLGVDVFPNTVPVIETSLPFGCRGIGDDAGRAA